MRRDAVSSFNEAMSYINTYAAVAAGTLDAHLKYFRMESTNMHPNQLDLA